MQRDRLAALDRLLERFHGTVVLKGAGTLVGARGRTPGVCERGNPGMASAGMGDALTGAIAGILAQCHDPWAAARVGVLVHAMAGDAAARAGERGLLASDVVRELHAQRQPVDAYPHPQRAGHRGLRLAARLRAAPRASGRSPSYI